MSDPISVQVALRIRPLVESETNRGCKKCLLAVSQENQVQVIGTDKAFSYNFVFDETISQQHFYENAVQHMLAKLFKGYNVTILAYGQTGSGKTHSMGTSYDGSGEMGVIPRAIHDIFTYVEENSTDYTFRIAVSFMELYQESLYDLLANRPREQCTVDIREDTRGIKIPGLTEQAVDTVEQTLRCLVGGSAGRATGATAMNAQSSRSHAIFTITIYMEKKNDPDNATTSKFHLVDLAGSERSKKTKATGERFKEGVNINRGLLALGNVISALGDSGGDSKGYISYRDSKLTRLLQDSLGGNSVTLMIACVSPADYNLEETISTLRYADRARKIKNKPIVNQDPKAAEIARLQQIIQQYKLERYAEGTAVDSNVVQQMREENIRLQQKNRELNAALSSCLAENTCMFERALLTQSANDKLQRKLLELKDTYNITLTNLNNTIEQQQSEECSDALKTHVEKLEIMQTMISEMQEEHKKDGDEIQEHEYQTNASVGPHCSNSVDHELHNGEPDLDEKQEIYTKEQLDMNTKLKELTRGLQLKEQLASQLVSNTNFMVDYTALYDNENKISSLEKEKEELLTQLKSVHTNTASSKLAEQRRKRVKELETQISELNKKVVEQARLIKLKEKDELKIKRLNSEIQTMKATKVKLIKTMRAEEHKFRDWKMQREKELMRLKDQDRKRQNQLIRMENMHHKQQNVLKRKVEEAAAINKRLKDAMALQKQSQDRRINSGKTERVENWIEQEFEVMISTQEAQRTLEQLIEDRAVLNTQLSEIKSNSEYANTLEGKLHIQQFTEDIDLRSAQISDLQQKIIDSDQENKSKTRWDTIQSMIDAKCALKKLFELAANISKKGADDEYKIEELSTLYNDAQSKLNSYENKLKEQNSLHENKVAVLETECAEKITVVLRQLRGIQAKTDDEDLKKRLRIQDEELEKMDGIRKELEQYKEQMESLKQMNQSNQTNKKKSYPKASTSSQIVLVEDFESSMEEIIDDEDNDPDWKKTPLYKRMLSAWPNNERPAKRSSDGMVKCQCKGNCSTKICGCQKKQSICSDQCNCAHESCQNRDPTKLFKPVRKIFDSEESDDDSFRRPAPPSDQENDDSSKTKKKFKKSYFGVSQ